MILPANQINGICNDAIQNLYLRPVSCYYITCKRLGIKSADRRSRRHNERDGRGNTRQTPHRHGLSVCKSTPIESRKAGRRPTECDSLAGGVFTPVTDGISQFRWCAPPLPQDRSVSDSVMCDCTATGSYHELRFREQLCGRERWVRKAIEHGA
jgi:hypothetical protein